MYVYHYMRLFYFKCTEKNYEKKNKYKFHIKNLYFLNARHKFNYKVAFNIKI